VLVTDAVESTTVIVSFWVDDSSKRVKMN